MKVLLIHNSHRSGSASGDDVVFKNEAELLSRYGHEIIRFNPSNDEFDRANIVKKGLIGLQIPWSIGSFRRLKSLVLKERPRIAHFHNIFPLISPSAYYACLSSGVPVVQTLHDFRIFCANAFLFRDGRICEACLTQSAWKSVRYRCLRNSLLQTIVAASMICLNHILGTWKKEVTLYISLTTFGRRQFIQAGFPQDRIVEKPHFLPDPPSHDLNSNGYAVFIGRLGYEKGVNILLRAWRETPQIPLRIIGDGPERGEFQRLAKRYSLNNVKFLGYRSRHECLGVLKKSHVLIMPSTWYETFGLTIIEAYACGKPVIASDLGGMGDLIKDGKTGLLFKSGNSRDLASKVRFLFEDKNAAFEMGRNARVEFEMKYTAEKNYDILMDIYNKAERIHKGESQ